MPSELPLPTISTLLQAGANAVRGEDPRNDTREGSTDELLYGPTAILFAQQARRDRDMFRAAYFNSSRRDDLTRYVRDVFEIERVLAEYGVGRMRLKRATTAAGAGTIYAGTRIHLATEKNAGAFYVVTADTDAAASDTYVNDIPIRATFTGKQGAVSTSVGGTVFDTTWDSTWQVDRLVCGEGNEQETDQDFAGRVRTEIRARRVGYPTSMRRALVAAGASRAVLFSSTYGGSTDYGINACYVGSAVGSTSATLLNACHIALESWRVAGADLLVLGMTPTLITFTATITMANDLGSYDMVSINNEALQAIKGYLRDPQRAATYKLDAMAGAIARVSKAIHDVAISSPGSDATLSPTTWPALLPQAYVTDASIALTFQGST